MSLAMPRHTNREYLRLTGLIVLALGTRASFAVNDVDGTLFTLSQNGGWSWFQDPRVIVDNGQLIVGSVAGTTAGGATAGDIQVTTYNLASQIGSNFVLHSALQQDDHDVPTIVTLPDGRYIAIYQRHGNDNLVRWRISSNAGSTAHWNAEQTGNANPTNDGNGNTYANPFYLSIDNTLYNFSR